MKTLDQAGDLKGKKVFLRTDFDVPVGEDGMIQEEFRIRRQKETLHYLLDRGAQVVMGAHISAVPSFTPLLPQLERILEAKTGDTLSLLENLRSDPGEEANDESFARRLIAGCDLYVNNAFAVCHREHASVVAATALLPAYAGLLVTEETGQLMQAIQAPVEGKVIFIGGAKVSTKMPVVQFFLDKAAVIAVGGAVANDIGTPTDPRIRVATDFVMDGAIARDIGPDTESAFAALAHDARFIVWNGPMGKFEDERFAKGTNTLARAIAQSGARKIIGGGDTVAAVDKLGLLGKMGFVSTGGGAMLAFLAGQRLPGLAALDYYDALA